jgi:alkyl hydroperoxide reductase subunit F
MKEKTGVGALPQVVVNGVSIGGYADLVNIEITGKLYKRLGMPDRKSETVVYDVIILGAGPAGLSAAIYTARKVMKTLVISRNIGGQVASYYDLENYLGFSQMNAPDLVAKFDHHVKNYGVDTAIGEEIAAVDFVGPFKRITTSSGKTFLGKSIIIATGSRHRPLNIPGEQALVGRGVSYCSTCDAPLYADVAVAVIGGGNSGLTAVLDLIHIAEKIYLVSTTGLTGDQILQEKVINSNKVEIFAGYRPVKILGENGVEGIEMASPTFPNAEPRRLSVEGVFVEIGLMPNSSLFIDTLAVNRQGEILIDTECRTGLCGVFACGDVTSIPFKQVVVAAGEGAKAALSAYNYLIMQR